MTTTVPYIGALNTVGVTTGEPNVERAIRQALQDEDVVLWFLAEADDLDAGDGIPGVDLSEWKVLHKRLKGNPGIDGCAMLLRKDVVRLIGKPEWRKISPAKRASRGDRGMAARYSLGADVRIMSGRAIHAGAVHLAPSRYPQLRNTGAKSVRALRYDLWGGDLNLHPAAVRRVFPGYEVRGLNTDVMNLLAKGRLLPGTASRVHGVTASDHSAVKAPLRAW